jgi:hypothetical protein
MGAPDTDLARRAYPIDRPLAVAATARSGCRRPSA